MALHDSNPRLIIIVGPTGIGKSKLALKIAEIWGGEIISADSMQVYRYMDIGTAKPDISDRADVPHHLIDVVYPDEKFNAALYTEIARKIIDQLAYKKPVVVVGGTGLYIKALLGGLIPAVPSADDELRDYYRNLAERFSVAYLYELLKAKDEIASRYILPSDKCRIIRALEVWDKTGKSIVEQQAAHRFSDKPYTCLKIGLTMPRLMLYETIERRMEEMIKLGFIDEVKWLLDCGYGENLKPMQSIGYRHMTNYLHGNYNLAEALASMVRDTRNYAKRQLTWFTADKEIRWFAFDDISGILNQIKGFLL